MSLSSLIRAAVAIQQVWKSGESLHVDVALGPHGFKGVVVNRSVATTVVLTRIDFTADWRGNKLRAQTMPIERALEPNQEFPLRLEDQNCHIQLQPGKSPPEWAIAQTRRGHRFRKKITHERRVLFKKQNKRCAGCGGQYWPAELQSRERVTRDTTANQHPSYRWDLVCSRCNEKDGADPITLQIRQIRERQAERRIRRYGIRDIAWRIGGSTGRIPGEVDKLRDRLAKLESENRRLERDMRMLAP